MKVTSVMLADAAALADGKLYVHGGGWDVIWTPAVPTTHPTLSVVFVIEFEWSETHVDRALRVTLHDEDDKPLNVAAAGTLNVGHPPGATHGAPILQPIVLPFAMITFERVGRYYFRIALDETELARVRFGVRTLPAVPNLATSTGRTQTQG
jgi:hypothetical protein